MKFVPFSIIAILLVLTPPKAIAQLDSSYELLLGVPVASESLKAPSAKKNSQKRQIANEPNVVPEAVIDTGRPMPIKLEPAPGESPGEASREAPIGAPIVKPDSAAAAAPEPSFSDQAQSLLAAKPEKVLTYYHEQFEATDPRQNKVEITFAPTFVTNESASNYSYRNYRSVFSALTVGANVWLTPAIGLGGNFLFSLGADTSGDAATGNRSPVRHEVFDLALKFRQFFGFSSHSKSIVFDVLYTEYKFNVPSDDLYRVRLKTSGLGLKTSLRLPVSSDFAVILGGSFFPRLQHRETAAGAAISSGENVENTRIGLHVGSELKLSKESQIFWEASASSEKNLFNGTAGLVDSATGTAPKNVSATNSFYLMNFGYRWGN